MKLSVSLPEEDVEYLDAYAQERGIPSRSAAVHEAVRALRESQLARAYELAWDEWSASGEQTGWDATVADGTDG